MKTEACGQSGLIFEPIRGKLVNLNLDRISLDKSRVMV
jgi:hypothetical protein